MKFYCIRHGIAEESSESTGDLERKLTKKGKDRIKDLAKVTSKLLKKPDVIFTSEAIRSIATAEILASEWEVKKLETLAKLNPGASLMDYLFVLGPYMTKEVVESGYRVCFVTHEPDLSNFIFSFLTKKVSFDYEKNEIIIQNENQQFYHFHFRLSKGSILVFDWDGENSLMQLYLTPSVIKKIRKKL